MSKVQLQTVGVPQNPEERMNVSIPLGVEIVSTEDSEKSFRSFLELGKTLKSEQPGL